MLNNIRIKKNRFSLIGRDIYRLNLKMRKTFPETVGITASKRKLLRIFIKMQYITGRVRREFQYICP